MTLAFSQHLNKIPTYFVEKILTGLHQLKVIHFAEASTCYYDYIKQETNKEFIAPEEQNLKPKIHTIRTDNSNRWKAGNLIHFVINNRTPNRYQFARVLKCVSTQKIIIKYFYNPQTEAFDTPIVMIGDKQLSINEETELAIYDGFQSAKAFFNYFDKDFRGKIIHWTDKKY